MTGKKPKLKQKESSSCCLSTENEHASAERKLIPNNCCNKTRCACISFLWRGVNVDLGTSDEGMYGEIREKGLKKIFSKMSKYGMDKSSILLDIGSGRGVPNIVASFQNNLFSSIGIELDENAFFLSLSNHLHILESSEEKIENSDHGCSNNQSTSTHSETNRKPNIGFFKGDATSLETFEPVTHIYSFDAAMPVWMVKRFANLFNMSNTTYCYASYRKDLIETLGLKAERVHGISTQMTGSGEGRMCWLYLKSNWKEIRDHARLYINDKYTIRKSSESFDIKNPTNIDEIIRFSICNSSTQKSLIHDSLNFWFNNRKSRREYLAERKLMNQRHKELKQSYINERSAKEGASQLTLEDVGVKSESNIPSSSSSKNIRKQKLDSVPTKLNTDLRDNSGRSTSSRLGDPKAQNSSHTCPTIKIIDPSNALQKKSKAKRKVVSSENQTGITNTNPITNS